MTEETGRGRERKREGKGVFLGGGGRSPSGERYL